MTKIKLVAALMVLVVAGTVLAQDAASELEAGRRWLLAMNHKGDKDDTISRAEFNRYMDREFREADTDHDGTLNAAELGHLHTMLLGK